MPKYLIDTDKAICKVLNDSEFEKLNGAARKYTLADKMAEHRGAKEYTGIVETIQKWFYFGNVPRTAWCASGLSYFAHLMGILNQLGGKNENVYAMLLATERTSPARFYRKDRIPEKLLAGDVLFWMWDNGAMTYESRKHVNVCEYDTTSNYVYGIGCNQKNKICTLEYNRSQLYAVYRPDYSNAKYHV